MDLQGPHLAVDLIQSVFIAVKAFPQFEDLGVRGSDFGSEYDLDVRGAILKGYEQEREQYNEIDRRRITAPKRGSAASGHAALNKRRPGVKELDDLARIAYLANAQFAKGGFASYC